MMCEFHMYFLKQMVKILSVKNLVEMTTIKYNTQSDEVSIAESTTEDTLMERNFKCVSIDKLRSLLCSQKCKGMIIYG